MKVSLVEKDDKRNKLVFDVEKTEASYVNTLRRLFMTEVPVMAVEDVEFRKNDSGLYDEVVAHRLGLIPFTTDLKSYNLPGECKCKGEGCARCQLKMTLKAKGPGMVYASDIKTKDPKVKPVFPKIPVVKLLDNQELELEMTAVLGLGKDHVKWSPCLAYYRQLADVSIESQPDNKEHIAENCPVKAFDVKNDKLILTDEAGECTMCNECPSLSHGKIKVTPTENFRVTIESWGQLDSKDIVVEALKVYDQQLEEFASLLAKVK
ncbi:DNA-directed RNA polymerase subunit D [Candidatus Woesearchaeota archaeon]|nr:DNA-directed RNA polymerase subunit D [Candidatus Woesearchaeota archaeon]